MQHIIYIYKQFITIFFYNNIYFKKRIKIKILLKEFKHGFSNLAMDIWQTLDLSIKNALAWKDLVSFNKSNIRLVPFTVNVILISLVMGTLFL